MRRWCGAKHQGIFGLRVIEFPLSISGMVISLSFLVREPFDQRAHDLTGRFRVISNNDIEVVGTVFLDDALAYTAYAGAGAGTGKAKKLTGFADTGDFSAGPGYPKPTLGRYKAVKISPAGRFPPILLRRPDKNKRAPHLPAKVREHPADLTSSA